MKKVLLFILMGLLILLAACGGGASVADLSPALGPGQSTKAVITFSLISTQTLPFRLNGVEMTAMLPPGLTVTTANAALPRKITSGLDAGSAVSGVLVQVPIFGSYSAPKVKISLLDSTQAQTGFGPGEMASLTCSIAVGTTLNESDRLALENTFTFKASGWDPRPSATTNPSPLNLLLEPRVTMTLTN